MVAVWLGLGKETMWFGLNSLSYFCNFSYIRNLHYVTYVPCPKLKGPLASVYTLETKSGALNQSPVLV